MLTRYRGDACVRLDAHDTLHVRSVKEMMVNEKADSRLRAEGCEASLSADPNEPGTDLLIGHPEPVAFGEHSLVAPVLL